MNLSFEAARAHAFKGPTQKIKALSEHWVGHHLYCPSCGRTDVSPYPANRPVADFFCSDCNEEFELKSQGRTIGSKVGDGAYRTMMERLSSKTNPSLLLLHYDKIDLSVINLMVIPKYFFLPDMIEQRKPLKASAKRAGWVGCRISLRGVPDAGKIIIIKNNSVEPKERVVTKWQRTRFLQDQTSDRSKGWLIHVMRCVERLNAQVFALEDCYRFEDEFRKVFPSNRHIREKIRQQLQVLRDRGFLEFQGRGVYRLTNPAISNVK